MLREEEQLESLVNNLQKDIENGKKEDKETTTIQRKLDETTRKLEKIIEYKTKGAILRSKCRWHNEGEKNTKYFLNLEKIHYKSSVITQLKVSDTDFITSDNEILKECETFYRNIYSSKTKSLDSGHLFFDATGLPSLDPEEKEKCEGPLTKTECFQALKSMNGEKTPGSDGLPADFYKVFWNNLADCLVNSINYAYEVRQFSVSQRRGIIKVIPKKDADPCLVKNWRPITLLNTDYKIAAKAIANRLKIVIPKIVNNDQTGFIKGRFIGENIRLIEGIINYTATQNIPGQLLFLDFEKAFDTVERLFIWKTLESFNFGSSIINWIKLCYQNIESCILNNGWASGYFTLDRGVRQGCPLSPYIFIICVELLAEKIRQNKTIKGISVQDEEINISQFADDATIILDGSKESFTAALQDLEQFGSISGLRLNNKKTEVLWIGSKAGCNEVFCPEKNLKWVNKVKSLGVWISTDSEASIKANYDEKIEKAQNVLSSWKYRRLSLLGKIVYNKLISLKQTSPSGSQSKWIADCNLEFPQSINWNAVYETPFCCTKASKLIVFQFKLLHRRLATNDYLHKIGLRNDDICTFCKNGKESLAHLFWHCKETFSFWGRFQDLLTRNQVTIKENNYSMDLILGLKIDVFSHLQHYFYFLVARYFIWTCKMKEIIPSINNFSIFLQHFCDLEYDEKKKSKPLKN